MTPGYQIRIVLILAVATLALLVLPAAVREASADLPGSYGRAPVTGKHPEKVKELTAKLVAWEKEMGVEQYSGVQ